MLKLRHLPNLITVFRILLTIPVAFFLMTKNYKWAFFCFLAAGFSDGADGLLARAFNWHSKLGAFLDPLADKFLMIISFAGLGWQHQIPNWLFWLILFRDAVIMSGVGGIFYVCGALQIEPSLMSKCNTALQVIFISLILFHLAFITIPMPFLVYLMFMVAATTALSLLGYIFSGIRQIRSNQFTAKKSAMHE